MFYLLCFLLFPFFYCFYFFFHKKISILLVLEGLMVILIVFYSLYSFSSSLSTFCVIIFSCIMVTDSVFGISVLISCTRSSSGTSSYLFSSI